MTDLRVLFVCIDRYANFADTAKGFHKVMSSSKSKNFFIINYEVNPLVETTLLLSNQMTSSCTLGLSMNFDW